MRDVRVLRNGRRFARYGREAPLSVTMARRGRGVGGRFGGGWNWSVGVQAGGRTLILNLLVVSVRIDRRPR